MMKDRQEVERALQARLDADQQNPLHVAELARQARRAEWGRRLPWLVLTAVAVGGALMRLSH